MTNPKGRLLAKMLDDLTPKVGRPQTLEDVLSFVSKEKGIENPIGRIIDKSQPIANRFNQEEYKTFVDKVNSMPGSKLGEYPSNSVEFPATVDRLALDKRLGIEPTYQQTSKGLRFGQEWGDDAEAALIYLSSHPILENMPLFPPKALSAQVGKFQNKDGHLLVPSSSIASIKSTELPKKDILSFPFSGFRQSVTGNDASTIEKGLNLDLQQISDIVSKRRSLLDRVLFGIRGDDVDELVDLNKRLWK
jgi:hypothetical protein